METNNSKELEMWEDWAAQMIYIKKRSNKPFKSGKKIGQIMEMGVNPHSGKSAFLMEDGTYVDCSMCEKPEKQS